MRGPHESGSGRPKGSKDKAPRKPGSGRPKGSKDKAPRRNTFFWFLVLFWAAKTRCRAGNGMQRLNADDYADCQILCYRPVLSCHRPVLSAMLSAMPSIGAINQNLCRFYPIRLGVPECCAPLQLGFVARSCSWLRVQRDRAASVLRCRRSCSHANGIFFLKKRRTMGSLPAPLGRSASRLRTTHHFFFFSTS